MFGSQTNSDVTNYDCRATHKIFKEYREAFFFQQINVKTKFCVARQKENVRNAKLLTLPTEKSVELNQDREEHWEFQGKNKQV